MSLWINGTRYEAIVGGTIDATPIGGTTPAAGAFTTGSFSGDVSFSTELIGNQFNTLGSHKFSQYVASAAYETVRDDYLVLGFNVSGPTGTGMKRLAGMPSMAISMESDFVTGGVHLSEINIDWLNTAGDLWNRTYHQTVAHATGDTAHAFWGDELAIKAMGPGGSGAEDFKFTTSTGAAVPSLTMAAESWIGPSVTTGLYFVGGAVSSRGNFDVATSKFTVAAATGNTVVAGTFKSTGVVGIGVAPTSTMGLNVTITPAAGASTYGALYDATLAGTSACYMQATGGGVAAGVAVTNWYSLYVGNADLGAGASITNQYGLFIVSQTRGTVLKYGIWQDGTAPNYFGGSINANAIFSVDDVTDTSSGVTGSIHTDGGLGVAKKLYVGTTATIAGAFGCNTKAAQTAYASGGALAAYGAGANGFDSGANASALHALVVAIRAALVANGVMS